MPRINANEEFKKMNYEHLIDLLFPNDQPLWMTKEFFKGDRTHKKCIISQNNSGVIMVLEEGSNVKKQDLILNSVYLHLDTGRIIPEDIEYLNFKKTMEKYSKAKKICEKEASKSKCLSSSAMDITWMKNNQIMKKIEKKLEKDLLIVDNIEINNLAAEEFFTLKIGQRRNKKESLTFLVSDNSLEKLNEQFKSKMYKKIFNLLYHFNFFKMNIEEFVNNERQKTKEFKKGYENSRKENGKK